MSSRYLIGLDLGTTNSAVSYIDTAERLRGGRPTIHRFLVPQLVQPGEVEPRETLPSFLYFPTPDDPAAATAGGGGLVGVYARDHGALVPGRQVASAKSWLCNPAVDRLAPILPWGHDEDEQACSPVDASARFLAHMRDAWNEAHRETLDAARFERQTIVLTVPASFDEEARELTVRAAEQAGLEHVTLLEEPLAAFYAWIATHSNSLRTEVKDGDVILICDVGGGTTDFTLIRASMGVPGLKPGEPAPNIDESRVGPLGFSPGATESGEVRFERTAVGEHLLLGGDNLDLALARRIEGKLGDVKLTLRQQQALARLTSAAKEQLLTERGRDRVKIAIPAAGRAMVGGRLTAELTREEVVETLVEGFLPTVAAGDTPARATRTGLREFGLPYATEPAITRHLSAFLARAKSAENGGAAQRESHAEQPEAVTGPALLRPDAVLFNGGFFTPDVARDTVVRTIESWFTPHDPSWRLKVLTNRQPATAVAVGAAYYAFVREHGGVRVSGGSARAYYIGVAGTSVGGGASADDSPAVALCVMPRGTEEGTTLQLPQRQFAVATNRPVAFPLYSSTTRHDSPGDVVTLDLADVHQHAPLVTILRYGKKSRQSDLPVHLAVRFTEVGTLEIWCESDVSDHRWRLQFELRSTEHIAADEADEHEQAAEAEGEDGAGVIIGDDLVEQAVRTVRDVFGPGVPLLGAPETLVTQIENLFGYARQAWPLVVIRKLGDVLLEVAEGRRKAAPFEARWLNLTGFCLRPGFGATLDDWRMDQLRRIYPSGLAFPRELQNQAEWLVLWQRVAGGLTAGQQQDLYQRTRTVLGLAGKKDAKRVNPQVEREGWRLLASLELLPASNRASLGKDLVARVKKHPENTALAWSLGRMGARIPAYGPLNNVVPASAVSPWIEALLELGAAPNKRAASAIAEIDAAIVEMAARTGDAHRDIDEALRTHVIEHLQARHSRPQDVERVRNYVPPTRIDSQRVFGESLPIGLRLTQD